MAANNTSDYKFYSTNGTVSWEIFCADLISVSLVEASQYLISGYTYFSQILSSRNGSNFGLLVMIFKLTTEHW